MRLVNRVLRLRSLIVPGTGRLPNRFLLNYALNGRGYASEAVRSDYRGVGESEQSDVRFHTDLLRFTGYS